MKKSQLCYYMDSVTKNTPILLKENENIKILRIDEIVDEGDWYVNDNIVTFWGAYTMITITHLNIYKLIQFLICFY